MIVSIQLFSQEESERHFHAGCSSSTSDCPGASKQHRFLVCVEADVTMCFDMGTNSVQAGMLTWRLLAKFTA